MTNSLLWLAGMVLLPAAGLAIWAWFAMRGLEESLRSSAHADGMLFEIGPSAPDTDQWASAPSPG